MGVYCRFLPWSHWRLRRPLLLSRLLHVRRSCLLGLVGSAQSAQCAKFENLNSRWLHSMWQAKVRSYAPSMWKPHNAGSHRTLQLLVDRILQFCTKAFLILCLSFRPKEGCRWFRADMTAKWCLQLECESRSLKPLCSADVGNCQRLSSCTLASLKALRSHKMLL